MKGFLPVHHPVYLLAVISIVLCASCSSSSAEREARQDESKIEDRDEGFVQVATGFLHTCALDRSGQVECWGESNDDGQLDPPEERFEKITAGLAHSCGLTKSREIACWGLGAEPEDSSGVEAPQDPHSLGEDVGQAAPPEGEFTDVDAGWNHTCALTADKKVRCWGHPRYTKGSPDGSFTQVSAGSMHTCALTESGDILCWEGDSDSYWAGEQKIVRRAAKDTDYVEVAVGRGGICGRTAEGKVECWRGLDEQVIARPSERFVALSSGDWQACGIEVDGTLACWTVLSDESETSGDLRTCYFEVPSGTFRRLSSTGARNCAVAKSGDVECWNTAVFEKWAPPLRCEDA